MSRQLVVTILWAVAFLITVVSVALIVGQQLQGGVQPWDSLLAANVVFAKTLPFVFAVGILFGLIEAVLHPRVRAERRTDGALRRFGWSTVITHWINAIGFIIAIFTGGIQYLKGVLDVPPPAPLSLIYSIHFIGASAIVFAVSSFTTRRLLVGDFRILPRRGQILLHVRGLVDELPQPLGRLLAGIVGINLRRPAPPAGQFKYYEKVVSFPIWAVLLALIVITGTLKAMRYIYPIPGPVLFWASFIHVAAMVMLAAKFLDHLRYVLAPSRWPMLVSMFTTWMSAKFAKEQYPEWYREVEIATSRPASEGAMPSMGDQAKARGSYGAPSGK